ncbi:MAG: SusC/RagA family TonB-linked outer membrane protein [Segetibacter sp.]|nr:SusC/RagA family TonB-linked outer membrane protein [Segetibacter sp.]
MSKTLIQKIIQGFFLILLLFSTLNLFAQQTAVKGKVVDEKGQPLTGVTVQVKGKGGGTSTDANGNFTISAAPNAVIKLSSVGYTEQEIRVNNQASLNIKMASASQALGEVVVVGYGTQRKSDLTGAISSVSAKDLEKATPINATEALQGRASGVQVVSNSGAPGSEGTIRIRGIGTVNNNDPIYVVDGMFVSSINYLSPSDIARIEVLKDASATAIYGSRGANGVILISTHRGVSGKPVIVFNSNVGTSKATNLTKTLSREQDFDYRKTAYYNGYIRTVPNADPNIDPGTSTDPYFTNFKPVKAAYDLGSSTDWAKELLKSSVIQSYDLAMRGGAQNVRYAASAGYFDQSGIIENSSYKRYTFRLNTDFTVNKRLVVGENFGLTYSKTVGFSQFDGPLGIIANILLADPYTPVLKQSTNPSAPNYIDPLDPDFKYNKYSGMYVESSGENPAGVVSRNNYSTGLMKLVGNVYGELQLMKALKFRSSIGYDYSTVNQSDFTPRYFISATRQSAVSNVFDNRSNGLGLVWENTLNYNTTFNGIHNITGLLGYTEELYKASFLNASRQNTPNNDPSLQVISAATGTITLTGNKTQNSLRSYFGRLNYSYSDRYLLTASIRRDGSSKFGPGNKWGTFPSASAGWRISNEPFFKTLNASFVNTVKLRAGWGRIGNQSLPGGTNNPYLSLVQGTDDYRYEFGDQVANGNYFVSLGTPGITWETSEQTNIGLDLAFLKSRLNVSADYFVKDTKDMLLQVQLPSYSGFPSIPFTNAGQIKNKGIELVVSYDGKAGNFSYGVSANASKFTNRAISLGAGNRPINANDPYLANEIINRTEVGRSIGEFYGWVTDGIFQTTKEVQDYNKNGQLIQPKALPGDFRFKDIDGNGVINANDKTWIGNPLPKLIYGFNLNMGYKSFDLSALFQGSYGNNLFNSNKTYLARLDGVRTASLAAYEAAWRGPGTSNTQPIISRANANDNFRISDWWVEDGSYMRLKNLQLGFTLPAAWATKMNIAKSRLWIGGTDLFTITKYSGNDPEAGLSASPIMAGRDFSAYPKMKRYSIGLNVTFQ